MRIHHNTLKKAKNFKIELRVEQDEVVAYAKDGTRLAVGLQGNKVLEEAITKQTGKPAKCDRTKAPTANKVKRRGTPLMVDADEAGEEPSDEDLGDMGDVNDEETSEADQRKSGVKHKYKERYKPFHGRCGDDLAEQITEHVTVETEDGPKVGKAELRRFAEANGCWVPAYSNMTSRTGNWNAGMARMNVSNRLRALIRRAEKAGEKFEIQWV